MRLFSAAAARAETAAGLYSARLRRGEARNSKWGDSGVPAHRREAPPRTYPLRVARAAAEYERQ